MANVVLPKRHVTHSLRSGHETHDSNRFPPRAGRGVRPQYTLARRHRTALPRSPSGDVDGQLVDVGYGLPSDFDRDLSGVIVLAASDVPDWCNRYVHRREKYSTD